MHWFEMEIYPVPVKVPWDEQHSCNGELEQQKGNAEQNVHCFFSLAYTLAGWHLLEIIFLFKIICRLLSRKTSFSAVKGPQNFFLRRKILVHLILQRLSTDMHKIQKHCLEINKANSNLIFVPLFWCEGSQQQNTRVSNVFLPFQY